MIRLWRRLPVVVRAVLTGLLVAAVGTGPWALLVSANAKHWSAVPWAAVPAALYLWLFWRYVRGWGWPRATADARRRCCRANPLADHIWGMALLAGVLGLVAVLLLQGVLGRLVTLPQQQGPDLSRFPLGTLVTWLVTGSLVAGVVEESAFRGYLQGPIERRHGPVLAILIGGVLFGFTHFSHPEVGLVLLPYYLAVTAVYGGLAWLTNSILPSLVLHAGGDVFSAFDLFARGRSEWQASPHPRPLVWETGPDASFWLSLGALLLAGAVAVWAYRALARACRERRPAL